MNSRKATRSGQGGWLFVFRIFAAIGTAMALVGCATPFAGTPQTEIGTIGLKRTSRESFLTFQAVVGEGPMSHKVHFVVDTGAEVSAILGDHSTSLAPTGAAVSVIGLHGARLDGKVVRAQLRSTGGGNLFGDDQAVGAEMVVLPRGARLPGNAQALLGIDFLKTHASYLDVAEATLAAKAITKGRRAGIGVDFLRSPAGGGELRFVACEYRGERLVWLLDTGASQSLLAQSSAEKIGALGIGQVSHLVDSGGHRVAVRHSVLRGTRWGQADHNLKTLPVGIAKLPHLRDFRLADGSPIDGVLGIDMLTRRAAIIDFQAEQMWLEF